jgi:hypothetical protein
MNWVHASRRFEDLDGHAPTYQNRRFSYALGPHRCAHFRAGRKPSPSTATFHGEVTDPVGDAVLTPVIRNGLAMTPVVPVLPDLIAATIDVSSGNLTVTVSFAPGTLSRADTQFCLLLDTDENPATGNAGSGADSATFGWDYSVCAVDPRGSTTAQIARALGPGQITPIGSSSATFPSADQARVTVPLSLLGNSSGRLAFKVISMQWVDAPIVNTAIIDWMPSVGLPPGLVR